MPIKKSTNTLLPLDALINQIKYKDKDAIINFYRLNMRDFFGESEYCDEALNHLVYMYDSNAVYDNVSFGYICSVINYMMEKTESARWPGNRNSCTSEEEVLIKLLDSSLGELVSFIKLAAKEFDVEKEKKPKVVRDAEALEAEEIDIEDLELEYSNNHVSLAKALLVPKSKYPDALMDFLNSNLSEYVDLLRTIIPKEEWKSMTLFKENLRAYRYYSGFGKKQFKDSTVNDYLKFVFNIEEVYIQKSDNSYNIAFASIFIQPFQYIYEYMLNLYAF